MRTLQPKRFDYNGELGAWWRKRAGDHSHIAAYRNVARYIHDSIARPPRLIVDYACGMGDMLIRLAWRFPNSRCIGLDGSRLLLDLAQRRIAHKGQGYLQRNQLIETLLPNFDLPKSSADLVVFAFPNMQWPNSRKSLKQLEGLLSPADLAAACVLVEISDRKTKYESAATIRRNLVLGRLVSLNLRRMLRTGGLCVRIEYSRIRRDELDMIDLMRVAYEEGSLETMPQGRKPCQWFRVLASSFFRSGVTEDVYQQSHDPEDRRGGYWITVLRAV
jgi:SAM-dependent methyltransferase